jgi:hypothetical protein
MNFITATPLDCLPLLSSERMLLPSLFRCFMMIVQAYSNIRLFFNARKYYNLWLSHTFFYWTKTSYIYTNKSAGRRANLPSVKFRIMWYFPHQITARLTPRRACEHAGATVHPTSVAAMSCADHRHRTAWLAWPRHLPAKLDTWRAKLGEAAMRARAANDEAIASWSVRSSSLVRTEQAITELSILAWGLLREILGDHLGF